jgi:hypothetical protein
MATTTKNTTKKTAEKKTAKPKKLSKVGKWMRAHPEGLGGYVDWDYILKDC